MPMPHQFSCVLCPHIITTSLKNYVLWVNSCSVMSQRLHPIKHQKVVQQLYHIFWPFFNSSTPHHNVS